MALHIDEERIAEERFAALMEESGAASLAPIGAEMEEA